MISSRRLRPVVLIVAGILAAVATAQPAAADTRTHTRAIDTSSPTMPVVFINGTTDSCTGQGVSPVLYDVAFRFKAAANGQHRFVLISEPDDFASFYLYEGSFDPDNGFENCVAGDNSTDDAAGTKKIIEYDATRRTRYIVVVFDDTFDQVGGDYTLVTKAPVGRVVGPGRRFVKMPDRIKCADARAVATWRARADQVESAMFKANTNNKVVASVTHIVPGRKVVLTGIPPAARRLTGVLKLESGSKLQVRRDYIRC